MTTASDPQAARSAAPTAVPPDGAPVVALPRQGLPVAAMATMAVAAAAVLLVTLNLRRGTIDQPLLATTATAAFRPAPALNLPSLRPVGGDAAAVHGADAGAIDPMAVRSRDFPRGPMMPFYRPGGDAGPPPWSARAAIGMASTGTMPPPYVPGQPFGGSSVSGGANASGDSALVIDIGREPAGADRAGSTPGSEGGPIAGAGRPIRATLIANRASLVPEGTVIDATLETPIDSTRPGLIRAIVSEDVRGFDGRRILVPRGSRLTGEYRADVQSGQRRVLATWTRLIRPDGVAVRIDSPAADRMGANGIPGRVETNFLQRFATAVLQSALNVGVNLASRGNGSTVIVGPVGGNMAQVLPTPQERRSIKVAAGQPVSVFVSRDLDFSDVPGWR